MKGFITNVAEEMSQFQICSVLDHLRDELPAHDMPVTLAALLYLRWVDFQEAEQEAIAAFDEAAYKPVLPAALHWRSWYNLPPHDLPELFSDRLSPALERLNNSRHNSLATHLHRIASAVKDLGWLSPHALEALIHWLAEQPFETPSDRRALLGIFDTLLDRVPDKSFSEFRTPAAIVSLLVELAAPAPGDRVYDPCFGTAGLLTAACDHVLRKGKDRFTRNGGPGLMVSGVELNVDAFVIGLTRLALAGVDDPQLELGNSLERTPPNNPQQDGFDVVLANPPWGMRVHPAGLDHFPVRTTDTTGLFIQHALTQLRPGGRAVLVVPEGFLFRGGLERKLRRMLVEQHTVEAVVSLPAGAFLPHTGIKASILVLRRGGLTKHIRMVDAEFYFEKGKGRKPATIQPEQIQKLAKEVRTPTPSENCWDVDIESLVKVGWDFTPKRRDRSGLSGILDSLRSEVDVLPLKECCKILSGRTFPRNQLLDEPPPRPTAREQALLFPETNTVRQRTLFDVPIVPYVRIKDVQRGQASRGSSWLSPDAAASVDARWKLKAGDVLLSKSGTIGKAGVARNGAVGAIAASGLFVLRPDLDRLDPHFLLAYFDSSECRAWLDDKARGATIRHLSKRILNEMPVPLPPLQIQQRVATQHREHGVDVLAFLVQLLTQGEDDPIAQWIDKAAMGLPLDVDAVDDPLNLDPLDRLASNVHEIRNRVAHDSRDDSALAAWILAFNEAVSGLCGVPAIPQGPGLLSVLQESIRALEATMPLIKGHLPNEAKARSLTRLVSTWLDRACSALLGKVKVIVSADVATLRVGKMVEIVLSVHNQGPLPLRNLNISTSPDWGQSTIDYLAEGTELDVELVGTGPKKTGTFTLSVEWSANTLDGQPIVGIREIAFDVVDTIPDTAGNDLDIGGSPYVCGDPVLPERNDVFFGREELLEQIRRQVVRSGNVVLLEGNRRSGKSSILWHLEGMNAVPGWLGVYCSLQGAEGSKDGVGVPTVEVFREMAKSIAKSMQTLDDKTPLPDGTVLPPGKKLGIAKACRNGIGETSSFSDFRDYVEVVLENLAKHDLGLLIMLDEFDKLQEGIDSGVTSPQVPENIRFLVQTYTRFCAILTGSRRLKRLREEYWSALYGLGTRFGVTSLPVEYARRLVTEPVKGRLTYSREAVERAIFLTSGQPYLLQCLCNRVFDMSAQLKTRSVTLDLVDQAGNALVEDNEHFASLWDYAQSNRRRFILALCHKEVDSPDLLRLGVIQERLFSHGIEVSDETLIEDLEFLRELELIELVGETGGGHYVLAIPLMGTWIEKQQDFEAVKSKARLETEDHHE